MRAHRQLFALLRRELLDLSRNRGALLPVVLVAVLALALPIAIVIVVPAATQQQLGDDADLARLSSVVAPLGNLGADGRVQVFLFQQFLLIFLLLPITGAMALAAHSVVGEKQGRTLEPLLATPISTLNLLIAKVLGTLVPTLAISLAGLLVYFTNIALLAEPGVLLAMVNIRTALLVLIVGPAAALVSLQGAIIVSSRVNDARTAQQFSMLIILPLTGLVLAQFTGSFWASGTALAVAGVSLLGLWILLALISVVLFERESILTRWR